MQNPVFDYDLILKYDKPGPRYTSYPTAPNFRKDFGGADFRKAILDSQRTAPLPPLSLYLHIPFCAAGCWFCGCNVCHTREREKGWPYLDAVRREVDALRGTIDAGRRVEQMHWGGGTPTFLTPEMIRQYFHALRDPFPFEPGAEISIEVDPRECSDEHLHCLRELGFNRISMGVQDLNPVVQKAIHRIQPQETTAHVADHARALGFESVNIDLVYGLPHQTVDDFRSTVDAVAGLDPDRVAVFNFAYLPERIRIQRAIKAETLPPPIEKLKILEMVIERLCAAGYVFIGMDHFAKPADELTQALRDRTLTRNFQGYTTRAGCDLIGVGASSISQLHRCYAQNEKDADRYQERTLGGGWATVVGMTLSDDDLLRRDLITRLMCHFVVYKGEIEAQYGLVWDERFKKEMEGLKPLEADGLVELHPDRLVVTPIGRLMVRNIAMVFDAWLEKGPQTFSRTV
jgi:oxygen-independent coproporphyrinogen-3 oxidase